MGRRITVIQGHPARRREHYCHALEDSYALAAEIGGHEVRRIGVATLDFTVMRSAAEFNDGNPPSDIRRAQEAIAWAEHLVIVYPLWLGTMPALLKAFLEQTFRPGFAVDFRPNGLWTKLLKGRTARVIVTMGMPAPVYRLWFGAHSLKSLERNILGFSGIGPVRETLIGRVDGDDPARRRKWLDRMVTYGRKGA